MSIPLDEAQRRVVQHLGLYVGDTGDAYTIGIRRLLQPMRQEMFNNLVRAEAERDHGQAQD